MLYHVTQLRSFYFGFLRCAAHDSYRFIATSLQEVLQVELKRRSREGQLEVLEHDGVHDTEAADLHGLLVGELQEDGGGVAGEVGGVCMGFMSVEMQI
jgi:hypothetical protein